MTDLVDAVVKGVPALVAGWSLYELARLKLTRDVADWGLDAQERHYAKAERLELRGAIEAAEYERKTGDERLGRNLAAMEAFRSRRWGWRYWLWIFVVVVVLGTDLVTYTVGRSLTGADARRAALAELVLMGVAVIAAIPVILTSRPFGRHMTAATARHVKVIQASAWWPKLRKLVEERREGK